MHDAESNGELENEIRLSTDFFAFRTSFRDALLLLHGALDELIERLEDPKEASLRRAEERYDREQAPALPEGVVDLDAVRRKVRVKAMMNDPHYPAAAALFENPKDPAPLDALHDFMDEIDRWLNARPEMHFKVSALEAGELEKLKIDLERIATCLEKKRKNMKEKILDKEEPRLPYVQVFMRKTLELLKAGELKDEVDLLIPRFRQMAQYLNLLVLK